MLLLNLTCSSRVSGNGIPPAPKFELQDRGKTARLTVRFAALPPAGPPLTLTLIDESRAAEFKVSVD